ncbi:MAG: hypothetical protein H7X97_12195, partial [Opitutaceae bacterium]|nr:hypothetical protein [Verrucomicrobiales bacterium]
GLWIGGAQVEYVSHYHKKFAQATNDTDLASLLQRLQLTNGVGGVRYVRDPSSGRVLVFGGPQNKTGSYLLDGPIKQDSGTVARPFPLRLIVHHTGTQSVLLQKAFLGLGLASNAVVTTSEDLLLQSQLTAARRVSAVHLPLVPGNVPWTLSGQFQEGSTLSTSIDVGYGDQASNPFLHTYHPDHDNLDALFTAQPVAQGLESYGVTRQITLSFTPPTNDFDSLTRGSQTMNGDYAEVVTFRTKGTQTKQFNSLGRFTLKRINTLPVLTTN